MSQPDKTDPGHPGPESTGSESGRAAGTAGAAAGAADSSGSDAGLAAEVATLQDRLLRMQAELENFRRRSQREMDESRKFESFRLVRDLLPALDGLDRALQSAEQSGDFASLHDGIRMVYGQFLDVLKAHAAEPIPAAGMPFDPNLHEALSQISSADVEPMTVLQVIEPGYRLHDRVVRPARVIVSCTPPAG